MAKTASRLNAINIEVVPISNDLHPLPTFKPTRAIKNAARVKISRDTNVLLPKIECNISNNGVKLINKNKPTQDKERMNADTISLLASLTSSFLLIYEISSILIILN